MIDYSKLKLAIHNLEKQWQNYESLSNRQELSSLDEEAIQESVIKRFDIALEMSWKHLMRYLSEEIGISELRNGPKPILRLGDQNGLLGGNIREWIEYVNARNMSAHDYSGEKASETLSLTPAFLADAIKLYEAMTNEPWTSPDI